MNPCSARGAWTNRANVGFGNDIMMGDLSEKLRSRTERAADARADASVGFSIWSSFSNGANAFIQHWKISLRLRAEIRRESRSRPLAALTGQRKVTIWRVITSPHAYSVGCASRR